MEMSSACAGTHSMEINDQVDVDDDGIERMAQSTRTWVIGQLGIIVKSPACSSSIVVTILEFLATVAFAQAGQKASNSKVAHVQGLGTCKIPLSKAIRSLAVARTAAIATDALPCVRNGPNGEAAASEALLPVTGLEAQAHKKPKAFVCLLHKVRIQSISVVC